MRAEIALGNGELLAAHVITVNAVNFSNACFFKNGKPVANSTAQIEDAVRSGPLHDQRDDDLRALSGAVSESGVVGQIVHTRERPFTWRQRTWFPLRDAEGGSALRLTQ